MAIKAATNVSVSYNSNDITAYVDSGSIAASIAELDTTDLASTAMEYIPGLSDWTYTTNVNNWNTTVDTILMPDVVSPGTLRNLVVVYTDESANTATYTWTAACFISGATLGGEATGLISISSMTLRCNGAPARVVA